MENKTSLFDIVFGVIMSLVWLALGFVWILSLNPASGFYFSGIFLAVCIFFLPVACIAFAAWMSRK